MGRTIKQKFSFLDYAPIVFISAKENQRIHTLFEKLNEVYENYTRRVITYVLNDTLLDAVSLNPPPTYNGGKLRVYYITQVGVKPPTFVLFINNPQFLHFSYQRFIENKIRENFEFTGAPLKIIARIRD